MELQQAPALLLRMMWTLCLSAIRWPADGNQHQLSSSNIRSGQAHAAWDSCYAQANLQGSGD